MPIFNRSTLASSIRPLRLHWFATLRSTNDHAAALRRAGELFAPALVLTSRQTAGRGRDSRSWWSGRGTITATFAFAPDAIREPQHVPLIAGVALRRAAASISGDDSIGLKWPNDLLHRGRKLAGLLCERIDGVDLIGVGLNVNMTTDEPPAALQPLVTSLSQIAGRELSMTAAVVEIANALHRSLSRGSVLAETLAEYERYDALAGKRVRVSGATPAAPIEGVCRGLDAQGRLRVETRGGVRAIISGHVEKF